MNKRYIIRLTPEEREQLRKLVRVGKAAAYRLLWARILLQVDEGKEGPALSDEEAAQALETTARTVERLRRRFVEEGLEAALRRKKRDTSSTAPLLDGKAEARLVALSGNSFHPKAWELVECCRDYDRYHESAVSRSSDRGSQNRLRGSGSLGGGWKPSCATSPVAIHRHKCTN
jgi:hypothetical protein